MVIVVVSEAIPHPPLLVDQDTAYLSTTSLGLGASQLRVTVSVSIFAVKLIGALIGGLGTVFKDCLALESCWLKSDKLEFSVDN